MDTTAGIEYMLLLQVGRIIIITRQLSVIMLFVMVIRIYRANCADDG